MYLLGNSSDIFTGIIYNIYGPPAQFCFDIKCYAESIVDDKDSPDYNVEAKVKSVKFYNKEYYIRVQDLDCWPFWVL